MADRLSQLAVEVADQVATSQRVRVSQVAVECLHARSPTYGGLSQVAVEVLTPGRLLRFKASFTRHS